jgi:hypothetical protein
MEGLILQGLGEAHLGLGEQGGGEARRAEIVGGCELERGALDLGRGPRIGALGQAELALPVGLPA